MSRKSKIIPLVLGEKKEVTVKEVSPFAVYTALTSADKIGSIMAIATECTDLSLPQLQGLYSSEIEDLTKALLEVNSSFLTVAELLGLKETIVQAILQVRGGVPMLLDELLKNFPPLFADLFKKGMEAMPGITAGQSL